MPLSFRHAHDHREELDTVSTTRAVGRSSLTQRHVARMSDQDRAADHAQRDAAWRNVIQRKDGPGKGASHDKPTDEPFDDRWGAGVAIDLRARIVNRAVAGDRISIMIGVGQKHGVRQFMKGYVVDGEGMLCEFVIHEVRDATSFALVRVDEKGIPKLREVVVNPRTRPELAAPRKDMRGRVVMISVEGGRTEIVIGLGEQHGARLGMKGHLIGSGGRTVAPFELARVDLDKAYAYVDETPDFIRPYSTAVLNPSH